MKAINLKPRTAGRFLPEAAGGNWNERRRPIQEAVATRASKRRPQKPAVFPSETKAVHHLKVAPMPVTEAASVMAHPQAEDRGLVRAAQQGDMAAFEELVARHRDKIYGCAFNMLRNQEAALDLSQDAWVKSWQRLRQFQGDSSFRTWLTRIVINLCLDHLRKQKRQRVDSLEAMNEDFGGVERRMPVVMVNPTARLERRELRQRIDHALAQLSPEHRTVLVLREFEEMDYKEIARVVGCSVGTIMSRLFYARRKLASLLAGLKREPLGNWIP